MTDVLLVQLPSPAFKNVFREWAGGMGTELRSPRPYPGHDQKYYDIPFSSLLYIAADLRDRRIDFCYHDLQGEERFDADPGAVALDDAFFEGFGEEVQIGAHGQFRGLRRRDLSSRFSWIAELFCV